MTLKKWVALMAAAGATFVVMGAAWAALDFTGLRPTLIMEHRALELRVAASETAKWIVLNDKRLGGQRLTPSEFDQWCRIGQRLGLLKDCK